MQDQLLTGQPWLSTTQTHLCSFSVLLETFLLHREDFFAVVHNHDDV